MRSIVLRLLRKEARAWWAHRALREQGQAEEAARRERASVRSGLHIIRRALATADAHVAAGRCGTTVHYARGSTLSSPEPFERMAAALALVWLGLPLIDTRPAPDPWAVVRLPLVAVGEDPDGPPWRAALAPPRSGRRAAVSGPVSRSLRRGGSLG